MRIRILKILLVLIGGFQALVYGLQNIANLDQAYAAVAYVASMEGHSVYPNHFFPPVTNPTIIWLILGAIITMELAGGLLALVGAVRMAMSHNGTFNAFNASKRLAIIGLGLMLILWIGMFCAIGGAYFQMWQTQAGAASLNGAFIYAVTSGLILGIVAQPEPPRADRRSSDD